ncbi:MAG: hypothetical protein JXL80_17575 [Planctomycetes bacterium]|nr:hypothetical protein [Planctomycetota bacterium]
MATYKSLTIAMRLDTADVSAGADRAIAEQRRIAAESKRINSELALYRKALRQRGEEMEAGTRAGLEQRVVAAEERKATLAESRVAQRALHERLAAAKAARAAEVAEYQKAATERRAMADRLYAATHTRQQIELRNLRRYYAQQRLMHRDNARMLAMIDRTYAAERQQIMARGMAAAPGTGVAAGGLKDSARSLIGKNIQFGAAMALGQSGGLGEIFSVGLMPGMAGLAGVTMGVATLVSGYQAAKRDAELLTRIQKEHAERTRESVRWMEELNANYQSAAESTWASRSGQMEDQAKTLFEGIKSHWRDAGLLDMSSAGWKGILGMESGLDEGLRDMGREAQELERRAAAARQAAAEERHIGMNSRIAAMQYEADMAGAAEIADTQARARYERNLRYAEQERRLREEHALKLRNLERAGDELSPAARDGRKADADYELQQALKTARFKKQIEAETEYHRLRRQFATQEKDLERQLTVARGGSRLEDELVRLQDKLRLEGATSREIQRQLELTSQLAQARLQSDLSRQMTEYAIQIDLATGKINEMEAAMRRFREAQPDADEATQAKAREAQAMAEKAKLAEWSRQQAEALKTEEDRLREYKAELDKAREAGYLTREQEIALLAARLPERQKPEESYVIRGQFGGDARDLQTGGVSRLEKVAQHGERTVRLLEEMLAELRGGGATWN